MKSVFIGFTYKKDGSYVQYKEAWPLFNELNSHFNRLAESNNKNMMLDWNFHVTKKIKRPFVVLEICSLYVFNVLIQENDCFLFNQIK